MAEHAPGGAGQVLVPADGREEACEVAGRSAGLHDDDGVGLEYRHVRGHVFCEHGIIQLLQDGFRLQEQGEAFREAGLQAAADAGPGVVPHVLPASVGHDGAASFLFYPPDGASPLPEKGHVHLQKSGFRVDECEILLWGGPDISPHGEAVGFARVSDALVEHFRERRAGLRLGREQVAQSYADTGEEHEDGGGNLQEPPLHRLSFVAVQLRCMSWREQAHGMHELFIIGTARGALFYVLHAVGLDGFIDGFVA